VKSAPLTPTGGDGSRLVECQPEDSPKCGKAVENSASYYRKRLDELDSCLASLQGLSASCEARFGDVTPDFDDLRTSLETVRLTIASLIGKMADHFESATPALAESHIADITPSDQGTHLASALDSLHFTVTAPWAIDAASSVLVTLWVHLESQRAVVMERARQEYRAPQAGIMSVSKGPVQIARGAMLTVRIEVSGASVEEPEDLVLWNGEIGCANFMVTLPSNPERETLPSRALIYLNGVQVARVQFVLRVKTALADVAVPTIEARVRKAFASYASEDRDEVLGGFKESGRQPRIWISFSMFSLFGPGKAGRTKSKD